MMNLVEQLESSNTDSILDLGLSKYEHREKFRKFADAHGFKLTIHFLDISKETRLKRVLNRNNEKGKTFEFEGPEKTSILWRNGLKLLPLWKWKMEF